MVARGAGEHRRTLPVITPGDQPYWTALRAHELRLQRCARCGSWRHPPRPLCNLCHSFETKWAAVAGTGTLHAWTVAIAPMGPAFSGDVPYVAAIVALDEGPRLASWVTDIAPEQLREGMRLTVWFDPVSPEVSLPKFRPVGTR